MGVSAAADIAESLSAHPQSDEISITIVVKAQTQDSLVLTCAPYTLVDVVRKHRIRDTAIILVRLNKTANVAKNVAAYPLELVS